MAADKTIFETGIKQIPVIPGQKPYPSTKKKALTYNSDSIETLRFPDNVRANPSMYLGSVDAAGVFLTARELLDNFIDEAMAKRASAGWLHFDKDGSYWVIDNGQGVPQGIKTHKQHINGKDVVVKIPTMQAVFGELHTSGKKNSGAYDNSIGVHGIGSKGTNATSLFFNVWTLYKGQWYTIGFAKGKLVTKVTAIKTGPKGPDGKTIKSGTVIHFKPDPSIFTVKTFPPDMAVQWARIMTYFNPGVTIRLSSSKNDKTMVSKEGVVEYLRDRLKALKVTESEPIYFLHKAPIADVIISFSNFDGSDVRGFTNGLFNAGGGKHVDSVTGALYAGLKPFIKTKKVEGKLVPLFREADLKDGMVGLVNAKLSQAQFSSQDKAKLTDSRVGAEFEVELAAAALKFFNANKALAARLAERATKINELKTKFSASKAVATALNALKRSGMPHNYSAPDSRTKVEDRELFIVEGDSAAGGVRKTKNPWQALLPLTGKIMNVMKAKSTDKALASKAIINILGAIGFDPKAADPIAKLTVGRIICLADPDPDGPFIGDTMIRMRYEDDTKEFHQSISFLADASNAELRYQVPVWHGGKEIWAEATAHMVKNVDRLVALEIGKTKVRVDESHRFQCVFTRSMRGRDVDDVDGDERLVWCRAEDLKVGDRIYTPAFNGRRNGKVDQTTTDKETGLGFQPVSKMRIQDLNAPVPVYCLTVTKHHSFIMPSGIVSANCHINSLLLTLFYKMLPDVFNKGMVYVADIPEFYTIYKQQLITGDTLSEVQKTLAKNKAPANHPVSHIKGWGEIDASLMRLLAVESSSRRLIQIKAIEHDDKTDFVRLMNDDVPYRREMLGLPAPVEKVRVLRTPAKKTTKKTTLEADVVEVKTARRGKTIAKAITKALTNVRTGKTNGLGPSKKMQLVRTSKVTSRTSA